MRKPEVGDFTIIISNNKSLGLYRDKVGFISNIFETFYFVKYNNSNGGVDTVPVYNIDDVKFFSSDREECVRMLPFISDMIKYNL